MRGGLPSGTVTFLFTDIEGSTRLWDERPAEMREALAEHDAILRAAISSNDGVVFATGGDGFAAAFHRAADAVGAATQSQSTLGAPMPASTSSRLTTRKSMLNRVRPEVFGTLEWRCEPENMRMPPGRITARICGLSSMSPTACGCFLVSVPICFAASRRPVSVHSP